MTPPTTATARVATGTGTDATRQTAAWLNQGAAIDSQRAFGTWRHYPITQAAPATGDPDIPGYGDTDHYPAL